MTESRDDTLISRDGMRLLVRSWPVAAPRGVVVVAHGLGEHGGAYAPLAEAVGIPLGLEFAALDFRGHGRSPGRRGVVRRYEDFVGDLHAAVEWVRARRPRLPIFVLGHSNGGQIALRYALESPDRIAGVVASNPFIRIAMPVPPGKLRLGRLLLSVAPWLTLRADTPIDGMTRDPAMRDMYRTDTLRHNRISAPLFFGMVEGGEMLMERAGAIRSPLLMIVGGQDPVVSPAATRDLFDRVGAADKTMLLYPKMLHEPFNELGRAQVFQDVARWIEPRLGDGPR
ncbi:alpha/beta hydrolase [Aquisphaera giovannonii]|uniref:alpha/beta hydrolase n=1 Tax=Aquisphaera giovannonii TaxID=406548 RepID=UPI001FE88A82|nr:alpha/beta hydrolase [Aquisphaera giovannonii]